MTDLTRILTEAHIPELPNPYFSKVRDCYDLPDGTRILISSDRISAFDRILAAIPFKGQVLTQTAKFWFEATSDICPNHVISYPDPNVVIGKRLTASVSPRRITALINLWGLALATPLGAWAVIGTETLTGATTTPQRRSYRYTVAAGRYEVRGTRGGSIEGPGEYIESEGCRVVQPKVRNGTTYYEW